MSGVDQCIQKFLDVARQTECFFLQKRLQLSVQKPEQVVKEVNSYTDLHSHLPWIFWSGPLHLPSTSHYSWSPNYLRKHKMNSRRTPNSLLRTVICAVFSDHWQWLCSTLWHAVSVYILFIHHRLFVFNLPSLLTYMFSSHLRMSQSYAMSCRGKSCWFRNTCPNCTTGNKCSRTWAFSTANPQTSPLLDRWPFWSRPPRACPLPL